MVSLGDDNFGADGKRRKYARGDAGRQRRPLNSGRLYDYVFATSAIVFFEHGKVGALGLRPSREFSHIIGWMGLKLEPTFSVDVDYWHKREAQARSAGQTNRRFFISDTAQQYRMPVDYVEELWTRDYLYRDEVDPREDLSGRAGTTNLVECLPGLVRRKFDASDAGFMALERLLRVLPGSVYEANLLEFMFEHNEANGRKDVRSRWSALWR